MDGLGRLARTASHPDAGKGFVTLHYPKDHPKYTEEGVGSIYLTEVDPQKAMKSKVSRHDIAGIWLAFFSRCQRYRCGQGAFGQKWREAKLKATRALDQQTDLASFSSYRPEVVKYLSMVWLQKGSVLWAEGDISDDCFYYVVAGFCDVIQGQDEQQHVVRRLGAGATFGDVAVRAEFEATRVRPTIIAGIWVAFFQECQQ